MAAQATLKLSLSILTSADKLLLEGRPPVKVEGTDMFLVVIVNKETLNLSLSEQNEMLYYEDGSPFLPKILPQKKTWEINTSGAHGQVIEEAISLLRKRLKQTNSTTVLTDIDGTEYNVAIMGLKLPTDVLVNTRTLDNSYLTGMSITLQEV